MGTVTVATLYSVVLWTWAVIEELAELVGHVMAELVGVVIAELVGVVNAELLAELLGVTMGEFQVPRALVVELTKALTVALKGRGFGTQKGSPSSTGQLTQARVENSIQAVMPPDTVSLYVARPARTCMTRASHARGSHQSD